MTAKELERFLAERGIEDLPLPDPGRRGLQSLEKRLRFVRDEHGEVRLEEFE